MENYFLTSFLDLHIVHIVKDENVGILRIDARNGFSYCCLKCKNKFFTDTSANE